ncbi:hypothetical protein [Propioniciclava sinopodophylli]|nr:hypothetical protein [Propioniciclava sinopodophylli]
MVSPAGMSSVCAAVSIGFPALSGTIVAASTAFASLLRGPA